MDLILDDEIDFALYEHRAEIHKIKPASSWLAEVLERMQNPQQHQGAPLPWGRVDGYRMRRGEVSVWAGINGHGKSMILSQVVLHAMRQGSKVVLASMEMPPARSIERMLRQASGGPVPTEKFVRDFHDWSDGRMWIYDHLGMIRPDRMMGVLHYCTDQIKPDMVVVDSLMKCGMSPDDYAGQKAFLNDLTAFAMQTGIHVHLVAHARKGDKETDRLDKFDIKGTSEITDQVDNVLLVQRNKRKEADTSGGREDEPDCFLTVAKQRHGDWEGVAGLWFDKASMLYASHPGRNMGGDW